jgi:hypothetical protein
LVTPTPASGAAPRHRRIHTTARELRGQLIVLVLVLWAVAAVNTATSGMRLMSGQVKGNDFLHFYALARVGATDARQFADPVAVREAQLAAVPQSADHKYPPVYGPQLAIALAPLAKLPYSQALALWFALSAALYLAAMATVLKVSSIGSRYFSVGVIAAIGFPPFWYLLQYGQLSAVALCLIVVAWVLLTRGKTISAGLVLGLLIYKPPLFAPIFAIVLLGGAWTVVVAMLMSGALEVASTALWVGVDGIVDYVKLMLRLPAMAPMMAARPDQMHSLRAFWSLIFGDTTYAVGLYAISAVAAIALAAYVWRRISDPSLRMAALLLSTVLASPHFYVYDLVILAPVWVWLTEWYLTEPLPRSVGRTLYVGFLAPFFGHVATVLPLQLSVLCAVYLLIALGRWARGDIASRVAKPLDVADLIPTGVGAP